MKKPLIGITSSYEHNPESENAYKTSVSIDYSRAVMNAGGIPVVLPVHDNIEVIKEQISHLDGLLYMEKTAYRKLELFHLKGINLKSCCWKNI